MFKHLSLSSLLIAATLVLTAPAQAAAGEPTQFLSDLANNTIAVMNDGKLDEARRQNAFRALLQDGFDLPVIARFVVGRYWRRASEEQRADFLAAFEDYLVGTYATRLGNYSGQMLQIMDGRNMGDSDVIVSSEIQQGSQPAVHVDWRLRQSGDDWRIIDIAVEGVSMAVAQRSEFGAVIRARGGKLPALTEILRNKASKLIKREVASK